MKKQNLFHKGDAVKVVRLDSLGTSASSRYDELEREINTILKNLKEDTYVAGFRCKIKRVDIIFSEEVAVVLYSLKGGGKSLF